MSRLQSYDEIVEKLKRQKWLNDCWVLRHEALTKNDQQALFALNEELNPIDTKQILLDAYDYLKESVEFHKCMGLGYAEKCGILRSEIEDLKKQLEQHSKKQ